jgi:hypothetical protein
VVAKGGMNEVNSLFIFRIRHDLHCSNQTESIRT